MSENAPDTAAGTVPSGQLAGIRLSAWRRLTQFVMLAVLGQWSFYGIFRCPFIVPYVSGQNCPVITCPGGLANQMLGKLAPFKARKRNLLTRLAPWGAFLALAGCLYVWLAMGQPRANVPIRVGEFFGAVRLTFEHADLFWLARTATVLGLVALGLALANFWCRFACPTGGALEIFKRFSLFGYFKTSACNGCDKCLRVCEMGTRPAEQGCTNCDDCAGACPEDAIRFGRKPS